jgi:pSer/pThr/pTyr-binding forkhead associated (FHA) protein
LKNYYQTLEVTPTSDVAEIRESYRRLSQRTLWDKDAFAELQEAYDVLTSPEKRTAYDLKMFGAPMETPPLASDILDPVDKLAFSEFGRRCPMGASGDCPVTAGKVPVGEAVCPECGVDLGMLPQPSDELEEVAPREWVARFDEETGRQHRLGVGRNTVGRESADVLLPDKTVSRMHAYVDISEERAVTIEDLGSTNGTMINGERLAPHSVRAVDDGDTVRFGSIRLLLKIASPTGEFRDSVPLGDMPVDFELGQVPSIIPSLALSMPSLAQSAEPEPLGALERLFRGEPAAPIVTRAKLIATRGDIISEHPLPEGVTTFGRRADCSIVLRNDPYVSSTHAQIEAAGDDFKLTDIGSTNGTLFNGERMEPGKTIDLKAGDEIVIGGTIFRFDPTAGTEETAKESA